MCLLILYTPTTRTAAGEGDPIYALSSLLITAPCDGPKAIQRSRWSDPPGGVPEALHQQRLPGAYKAKGAKSCMSLIHAFYTIDLSFNQQLLSIDQMTALDS